MTYSDKLKDPRWQKKRLEILERDEWECTNCGDGKSTLHIHHQYYEKSTDPWDYPDSCYTTLCETCHKEIADNKLSLDKLIAKLGYWGIDQIKGYAKALLMEDQLDDAEIESTEEAIGISDFLRTNHKLITDMASKNGGVLRQSDYRSVLRNG